MPRFRLLPLLFAASAFAPLTPAQAQDGDPWARAAATYVQAEKSPAATDAKIADLLLALYDAEQIVQIETQCSGYTEGLKGLVRPLIAEQRETVIGEFETKLADLFRRTLSEAEITAIGGFFASEDFQAFQMASVTDRATENERASREASETNDVSKEAVAADAAASLARIEAKIGAEAFQRVANAISGSSWSPAYLETMDATMQLHFETFNVPLDPAGEARFAEAQDAFFEEWSARCGFTYVAGDQDAAGEQGAGE